MLLMTWIEIIQQNNKEFITKRVWIAKPIELSILIQDQWPPLSRGSSSKASMDDSAETGVKIDSFLFNLNCTYWTNWAEAYG